MHCYDEEDDPLSPIARENRSQTLSPKTRRSYSPGHKSDSGSEAEGSSESEDERHKQRKYTTSLKCARESKISYSSDVLLSNKCVEEKHNINCNYSNMGFLIAFLILVIAILLVCGYGTTNKSEMLTIKDLKSKFPLQNDDIWSALESGIKDVITFNKPSVFILLYKFDGEETIERILKNISAYASCLLNDDCLTQPLTLTSKQLDVPKLREDYGNLIDKYKSDLLEKRIMIIKNLDQVPGSVAQGLHSFCDEYSPLVQRSLFFFTIRVEEFPVREVRFVEHMLRDKWRDIKQDHFEPLFTRISSMILTVVAENK